MPTTLVSGTGQSASVAATARTAWASVLVALGVVAATAYGLASAEPYRGLSEATVTQARAQDVLSVGAAALLLLLAARTTARAHLVRLGLFAYVAYTYATYLIGVPMNRLFLVYVALVTIAGAALLDGVLRLRPHAWPRTARRGLERGTGLFLLAVAALFAALWLVELVPFALGGSAPTPAGPGGVAYPIYVLDLVIVLPCVAVVGHLLLRGQAIGGPLGVVVLVKIVTLFTALWAGVGVGLAAGADVALGPDAVPSLVMLVACVVLLVSWLRALDPDETRFVRRTFWSLDPFA